MSKRRVASIAFTGAAVAAGAGFHVPAAFAASGAWTVTNAGPYTASAASTHLRDVTAGVTLNCRSGTADGSINKTAYTQSGSASFSAGPITHGTFGGTANPCSSSLGLGLKFDAVLSQGTLNAKSYTSGVTHGQITDIKATINGLSGLTCTASFTGSQPYSYNNTTGALTVNGNSSHDSLTTGTVNGCLGVIQKGDKNFFNGIYTVTPPAPVITRTPSN
jgi:hypothetical protein